MKNRELRSAVLLALVGTAVVLLGLSRDWLHVATGRQLTIAAVTTGVRGRALLTGAQELGYVGVAGVIALAATRRWGRTVVGAITAVAGVGIVVDVAHALSLGVSHLARPEDAPRGATTTSPAWAVVTLLGGLLLAAAGLLVAVRGRRWVALSSAYAPPAAREEQAPVTDKGVWDALDRDEDPTAADPRPEG